MLVDTLSRPLRKLRLSVTDRCNLRCAYCMPEEDYTWLPRDEILHFDEVAVVCDALATLGVVEYRITGGEPLLRRDLPDLVGMLASSRGAGGAARSLGLTTNGVLLRDLAAPLRDAGIDRLTVSIDTLRAERFEALCRRDAHAQVLAGIEAARAAGFGAAPAHALKLDTVVVRGVNDDELVDLLDFARQIGAELRFIEYMDVGGATRWRADEVVSRDDILSVVAQHGGSPVPFGERGSAPAERFRLPSGQVFGIVASTTAPFCRACDRGRLTADGMWFDCLYAIAGIDLKTPLRRGATPDDLAGLVAGAWRRRLARGAEERVASVERGAFVPLTILKTNPHLEMHKRGG